MRILLYCPMNPKAPRIWRRTMESIIKLDWADPIDFMFSANDNQQEQASLNITLQYNKARRKALEGDYDYLFTVESDMIIPPDALQRLVACNSGVAYGLYVFRNTRHGLSAYTELTTDSGLSLSDDPDRAREVWGKVTNVAGVGLGCTLISRETLRRIKFRLPDQNDMSADCDWAFALDCQKQGILQRCDLGVVCGHQSYTPYPLILWPDVNEPKLYRRESLPGVEMKPIQNGQQFKVGMGEIMLAKADNDTILDSSNTTPNESPVEPKRKSSKSKSAD